MVDNIKRTMQALQVSFFIKYKDYMARLDLGSGVVMSKDFQLEGIAGLCCRTGEASKHSLKKGSEHHHPDIDLALTRSTIINAVPVLHNSKVTAVVQWTTLKKQR